MSEIGIEVNKRIITEDLFYLAHKKLGTNYLREKYYKRNKNYVAPVKITLNKGNKVSHVYYIPILKLLFRFRSILL